MLNIKNNVDLKELEKFGFKYSPEEGYHNYNIDNFDFDLGDERKLNVRFVDCYYDDSIKDFISLLYDLIKADIVEKKMKLSDLIGYQLVDINNKEIIVKKGNNSYKLEFDEDYGDCCGYTELNTKLLFNKNADDNPVITNIKQIKSPDDEEFDSTSITFFGGDKKIATINARASSFSGWAYGACVTLKCKNLKFNEELVRY